MSREVFTGTADSSCEEGRRCRPSALQILPPVWIPGCGTAHTDPLIYDGRVSSDWWHFFESYLTEDIRYAKREADSVFGGSVYGAIFNWQRPIFHIGKKGQ